MEKEEKQRSFGGVYTERSECAQDDKMEIARHSLSHIMAAAVLKLYPDTKFGIGPTIENGFYYDFEFTTPLTPENLPKIEKEMRRILTQNFKFERRAASADEARKMFAAQPYKIELIDDLEAAGEKEMGIYTSGEFTDLCRGPHVESSADLRGIAFKLEKLAGAYWRGDEKRPMLTRIYAFAFETQAELDEHLAMLEEAKKRDHRKLGKELDLFSFHEEAPGMPFWHDKGTTLFNLLAERWRQIQKKHGYLEVKCPAFLDVKLWKQSGHYDHYKDGMFFIKTEDKEMALRPMDCPGAILMYQETMHSYNDLPLRVSELGTVYRKEQAGELHGLLRVQSITQDDAHIFITENQIESEVTEVLKIMQEIYEPYGLKTQVYLATRPDDSMGDLATWAKAEEALAKALKSNQIEYQMAEKDGAFYGPKIDIKVKDSLGRIWQTGTIQLDFFMPEKFALEYIAEDGKEHRPVMIHRALMGSLERFIGILIEHYAGNFPIWLAPVQLKILSVGEKHREFCREIYDEVSVAGLRAELDLSDETVGKKIRNATMAKVPYLLVIGDKEVAGGDFCLKVRGSEEMVTVGREGLVEKILKEK